LQPDVLQFPKTQPAEAQQFRLTDLGNAERLVAWYGDSIRFAPGLGWHSWDGRRWRRDTDGAVMRKAKEMVRRIYTEAAEIEDPDLRKAVFKFAIASECEPKLRAAVSLAETERPVIVHADQLDADPWLFNSANGTIDLRTGELREHRPDDLLTRLTSVSYQADARSPFWENFLERVTGGDKTLAGFLQRAVGYSLTGLTSEEVLFFAHGPTATGKSSKLEAIKAVLGEYAATADFETFLRRRGDGGIRNDIARLAGARFVVSIEVDDGKALAEGLLKLLTGGDTVAARFLYRETFEFEPRFKLWLAANERPKVSADDDAIWRRILQLPFTHVIPEAERDERVKLTLRTDPEVQTAILAWAIRGCLEWRRIGLAVPKCVRDYTDEYRAENDALRDWLADSGEIDPDAWTSNADLRQSYNTWCEANGEKPLSPKRVGTLLASKACASEKRSGARGWKGLRVF
jgi:putative DNA primase/helicase